MAKCIKSKEIYARNINEERDMLKIAINHAIQTKIVR